MLLDLWPQLQTVAPPEVVATPGDSGGVNLQIGTPADLPEHKVRTRIPFSVLVVSSGTIEAAGTVRTAITARSTTSVTARTTPPTPAPRIGGSGDARTRTCTPSAVTCRTSGTRTRTAISVRHGTRHTRLVSVDLRTVIAAVAALENP